MVEGMSQGKNRGFKLQHVELQIPYYKCDHYVYLSCTSKFNNKKLALMYKDRVYCFMVTFLLTGFSIYFA